MNPTTSKTISVDEFEKLVSDGTKIEEAEIAPDDLTMTLTGVYEQDSQKVKFSVTLPNTETEMNSIQEVLNQLKKAGYRITEQRKLLLHIILNNEYSSCKEIYYAAKKQDDKVGIATVYRTVQLLEDMELIHKEMVVRI